MDSSAILYHHFYNVDSRLFVYPYDSGIVMKVDDILGYMDHPTDLHHRVLHHAARVQAMELTCADTAVAAAMCLMIADVVLSPVGQKIASASAEYLSETLYHLLSKNHDTRDCIYAKIISIITDMRTGPMMVEQQAYIRNMIEDNKEMGLPYKLVELYTTDEGLSDKRPNV